MDEDRKRRRWRAATTWLPLLLFLGGVLVAWLLVRHRGWKTSEVVATVGLVGTTCGWVGTFLERRLEARTARLDAKPTAPSLAAEQLDVWRQWLRAQVLAARVEQGSQLDQMVSHDTTIDAQAYGRVTLAATDAERPRLQVGGRLVQWSAITREFDDAKGMRLVVLGEPGYGKTVAALTLIAHVNAREQGAGTVAELFSLAGWYGWQAEHADEPLVKWLAYELNRSYPQLREEVAQQLLGEGLVLPVLDGLDEIPSVERRRACARAIDAYARRSEPHRPFVLTCRRGEYTELARDWVGADREILLTGLQPDQIDGILAKLARSSQGWTTVREHHRDRDTTLIQLFANPLHLTTAMQVYRDRDPAVLIGQDLSEATAGLWELLIADGAGAYGRGSAGQVREWLGFIAAGMHRSSYQRLMLHELYSLDPTPDATRRAFKATLGVVMGLVFGAAAGLIALATFGWLAGLIAAAVAGAVAGVSYGKIVSRPELPSALPAISWTRRLRRALNRENLLIGAITATITGAVGAVLGTVALGLAAAAVVGPVMLLWGMVWDANVGAAALLRAGPPARLINGRPDAVLLASRRAGITVLLSIGPLWVLSMLGFGAAMAVTGGLVAGAATVLVMALFLSGLNAVLSGLDAWLYHYWVRWRLARAGLLPVRLPEFFDWCAASQRRWIRVTDAYEFRHRELLEHLASSGGSSR